jgi:dTDP-glucose 4,6-dehydratase
MRILITGGAGFIGSHHAEYFSAFGHDVHVADRLSSVGKIRNLVGVLSKAKIWIGDLTDQTFSDSLMRYGYDVLIHCAGATDVHLSIERPIEFTIDNVVATAKLLHAVQLSGNVPRKIVLYSTDEVYGGTPDGKEFDETQPFKPSNSYAASKVGVEGLASAYVSMHGFPIVLVRPAYTYGPRMHATKVIPQFVTLALEGKPMRVYERGLGKRDYLYVLDHSRAIDAIIRGGLNGEAYNMPANNERSGAEIAEMVASILDVPPRIEYVDVKTGQDRRYRMNGEKLRSLGWSARESFDERLAETVRWFRDHRDWWEHDYTEIHEWGTRTP